MSGWVGGWTERQGERRDGEKQRETRRMKEAQGHEGAEDIGSRSCDIQKPRDGGKGRLQQV